MAFQDRCSLHQFQSTHPSGVRHVGKHVVVGVVISIHAPQWGATTQGLLMASPALFQSTHPSGVRQTVLVQFYDLLVISIHAPQWGATSMSRHHVPGRDFNPRTPVGCDDITATLFGVSGKFQSTHPSGVRLCGRFSTRFTVVFQSTHPSGVRPPLNPLQSCVPEFQSTHPSGVRPGVNAERG